MRDREWVRCPGCDFGELVIKTCPRCQTEMNTSVQEALSFTAETLFRVLTQGPHPDGRDMRAYESAVELLESHRASS